jgi:hypothetical protein
MKKVVASLILLWAVAASAATPLMNLSLPTPGTTTGPQWASMLNTAIETIDSHNHTSGQGARVPTAGLNINADLTFNNYNQDYVNSTRFTNQSSTLAGASDLRSLYVVNGDLYFNNSSGTAVRITDGGAINVAALGTIGGDYGGSNAASVTFAELTSTYSFLESTGIVAKMSTGPISLFQETSGALGVTLQSPNSLGSAYTLTLPTAQGSANNVMQVNGSGQLSFGTVDSAEITDATIATADLADSVVTSAKVATAVAGNGLTGGGGSALAVNTDGSTLEITADNLNVKAAGITATHLATSVAGNGLAGGAGTALSVGVDNATIEISSDALRLKADGINAGHIIDGQVGVLDIGTNAVGSDEIAADAVGTSEIASNGVGTAELTDASVTQAKLAARATGTSVAAGGVAISSSSGDYSIGTTEADVTNLSVTITTTGRPVQVMLISDGTANIAGVYLNDANLEAGAEIQIYRGATSISKQWAVTNSGAGASVNAWWPGSSIQHLDTPSAGTYTYKVTASRFGDAAKLRYVKLIAYEI